MRRRSTADHLRAVGAGPATPIEGLDAGLEPAAQPARGQPTLDAAARRTRRSSRRRCASCGAIRDVGAIVLECTNMPPYAAAVRAATGLPVHDIVTLLSALAALARRLRHTKRSRHERAPGRPSERMSPRGPAAVRRGRGAPMTSAAVAGRWQFWIDRGGTFTDVVGRRPDGTLVDAQAAVGEPRAVPRRGGRRHPPPARPGAGRADHARARSSA